MTDAQRHELRFSRVFEAPRELVFACLTEPRHLTHFWGPAGTAAPIEHIHVELRPGGQFETIMVNQRDGRRYPTRATYLEIAAPERLVWREVHSGMTVTLRFVELDTGRTEVHVHQTDVPEAALSAEAQAGFLTSLDRFAGYLQQLTRRDT
jgi:uncharacterized protein YndB with AHSA1/START domain